MHRAFLLGTRTPCRRGYAVMASVQSLPKDAMLRNGTVGYSFTNGPEAKVTSDDLLDKFAHMRMMDSGPWKALASAASKAKSDPYEYALKGGDAATIEVYRKEFENLTAGAKTAIRSSLLSIEENNQARDEAAAARIEAQEILDNIATKGFNETH
eukprot:TRINITY_DN82_c0_g2_i2.p1 TRINITY_DN82_c0_g2~~TRINITY_DN82_c0_g2_i2.p1  ORF type:complete len:155 (-),score=28.27 TRINITY_DN82_c0_g2_i2:149-613(-)